MVACKELLFELEGSIESRYMKPPLKSHHPGHAQTNEDEEIREVPTRIPPGLKSWRAAVEVAENPSQLSLCIEQLQGCIAWDKSIMKVYCQVLYMLFKLAILIIPLSIMNHCP